MPETNRNFKESAILPTCRDGMVGRVLAGEAYSRDSRKL